MFAQQIGSMDKLIEYYNKSSEQELRTEMFELNKNSELAKKMQESIIKDIEVTPEEVRQFFKLIPKADRPIFGTELRVSQIVIIPKTTEEEKEKVVDRLRQFKAGCWTKELLEDIPVEPQKHTVFRVKRNYACG